MGLCRTPSYTHGDNRDQMKVLCLLILERRELLYRESLHYQALLRIRTHNQDDIDCDHEIAKDWSVSSSSKRFDPLLTDISSKEAEVSVVQAESDAAYTEWMSLCTCAQI